MEEWPKNCPDTLQSLCLDYVAENIHQYITKNTYGYYVFRDGIAFPGDLSDKLLYRLVNHTKHVQESEGNVISIFRDTGSTTLTQLHLPYTAVTSYDLECLCQHPVREIDITYCELVDKTDFLRQTARTLCGLRVVGTALDCCTEHHYDRGDYTGKNGHPAQPFPNLRSLCIREINFTADDTIELYEFLFLEKLLYPEQSVRDVEMWNLLPRLTHLDLGGCQLSSQCLMAVGNMKFPCLVSLSLCDVLDGSAKNLESLFNLTKLRHLDISHGDNDKIFIPVKYSSPSSKLRQLVQSMPHLTSLDISGTNLAGVQKFNPMEHRLKPGVEPVTESEGIEGLEGRTFEFLGLLDCLDDPSQRPSIPARTVTGSADEKQVLASVRAYRDKASLLTRALNHLFNLFRFATVKTQSAALEGILNGMVQHKHDRHIQISGSASLFYIVKGEQKDHISFKQKRKIIDCVLEAMERHLNEHTMMRNGCLTLCHFNIPNDVMYCYNRLVQVLLSMLREEFNDDFIQRIGIFLLNSLACQVEGQQKQALGDLGTIEVMCNIIRARLARKECDEIMEVAWSTLWNVTDETAPNCKRFMDDDGMYLFLDCLKEFSDKEELLRNMMGLMGNIAEVKELRPVLMIPEYVTVFSDFLESTKDGIEVSYNAAGVLAHMLSDGVDSWLVTQPSRNEVSMRMERAIQRWPIMSKRNINYRSFEPILRLVRCFGAESSQYWAIWALCNLTKVYPEKYCKLLKDEGGVESLDLVINDTRIRSVIRDLAQKVVDFITRRLSTGESSDTDMEDMDASL